VVVLPALAVPAAFYGRFAAYLADAGFEVLTFDPRGIGASIEGPLRNEVGGLTDWVQLDHRAAVQWLEAQPGPRFAVGHSLGGQLLGLLDEVSDLDGFYTVAAQLAYWRHYPVPTRYGMLAAFRVGMPVLARGFGYLPGWSGFGENVPKNVVLEWCRWLTSPGYLLDHVPDAASRLARTRTPVAMVGFTDDTYAPPRGVEAMAACLPASRTELRILAPADLGLDQVGHFAAFRPIRSDGGTRPHPLWIDVREHLDRWATPATAAKTG
jgi:predicted alpha/beta hydrolase